MKIGIVGYPGAGKTTIFNALTGLRAETGPGGRVREHMGTIKVPDPRVDTLAEMQRSKKRVYAETVFVDVGGGMPGAAERAGLSARIAGAMQGCDALVLVLRAFANPALSGPAAPLRELGELSADLILSDLGRVETRRERLKKEPGRPRESEVLDKSIAHLEGGAPLSSLGLGADELSLLSGQGLLSLKPVLYLLNQDEGDFTGEAPEEVAGAVAAAGGGARVMALSGKMEMDIAGLAAQEQPEYLAAMGLAAPARDRFVRAAYGLLELISFLTTGAEESRAWPVRRGTPAVKAAGKVHSDIERGFIRAEVIGFDELVALGGEKQARDKGRLRVEGKSYLVQDGDVITFRFNV